MRIHLHAALLLVMLSFGATPGAAQLTGACCFDETGCFELTEQECADQSGIYQGDGTTCADGACAGACCFFEGVCVYIGSPHTCWFDLNGTWMGAGTTCDPNPCSVFPRGACCLGTECVLWEEQHCEVEHGQWFGPESTCESESPCSDVVTGACCDTYGFCTQLTLYECIQQGWTYMNDGTDCDPNPCSPVAVAPGTWGEIKARYR